MRDARPHVTSYTSSDSYDQNEQPQRQKSRVANRIGEPAEWVRR